MKRPTPPKRKPSGPQSSVGAPYEATDQWKNLTRDGRRVQEDDPLVGQFMRDKMPTIYVPGLTSPVNAGKPKLDPHRLAILRALQALRGGR